LCGEFGREHYEPWHVDGEYGDTGERDGTRWIASWGSDPDGELATTYARANFRREDTDNDKAFRLAPSVLSNPDHHFQVIDFGQPLYGLVVRHDLLTGVHSSPLTNGWRLNARSTAVNRAAGSYAYRWY